MSRRRIEPCLYLVVPLAHWKGMGNGEPISVDFEVGGFTNRQGGSAGLPVPMPLIFASHTMLERARS